MEKESFKKDTARVLAGASLLFTAACGIKGEAKSPEISNESDSENSHTQIYIPEEQVEQEFTIEKMPTCINFGAYGTYCEEFNNYTGKNEITWHTHSRVEEGTKDLVDLKVEGGVVEFEMPKDGVINSIAGNIEITTQDENDNDVINNLANGNPAVDDEGNPFIPAGTQVKISYDKNNESNGLGIIFEEELTFENLRMNWGEYGISKAVYDENKQAWIVALDQWCLVQAGEKSLEDLKREGGTFTFGMPFDGFINNSAGEIKKDEVKLLLGNPVVNQNGDPLIEAGDFIVITYEAGNASAGFQLEFPAVNLP